MKTLGKNGSVTIIDKSTKTGMAGNQPTSRNSDNANKNRAYYVLLEYPNFLL